jgi:hypothetical protein
MHMTEISLGLSVALLVSTTTGWVNWTSPPGATRYSRRGAYLSPWRVCTENPRLGWLAGLPRFGRDVCLQVIRIMSTAGL